jgi:hypothetical protein
MRDPVADQHRAEQVSGDNGNVDRVELHSFSSPTQQNHRNRAPGRNPTVTPDTPKDSLISLALILLHTRATMRK